MSRSLRVAVIGGGFGQHVHVPAFRTDPRAIVEAVCVSNEERARALAERLSVPRAFGDWKSVVADPSIDAVALSVPPALQAEIAIAAARAHKHVFAEKPLAMNVPQARAAAEAVRAAGVIGAVDFEFRELAAWQGARDLLSAQALGPLRHVYINWRIETLAHRDPRPTWKRDATSGGGALNLFASHTLDAVRWMLAPVRRVAARLCASSGDSADSRVDAWLELEGGTTVSIAIAADATRASEHRIEIYGDTGALLLENRTSDYASGFSLMLGRRGEPWSPVAIAANPPGSDGRIIAVGALVSRFIDAALGHETFSPNFDDGVATQVLIDATRAADRMGTWQQI